MNIALLLAAGLMSLTVLVHVFLGGPEIMPPVRKASIPAHVRAVMDVIWHGITVVLICIAGGLFWLTWHDNTALLWVLSAIQIGFGLLFLWYGARQLRNLWTMPQWVIFLGVPALSLWGAG